MNIQDILTIFEYNYWANKRILDTSGKVTEAQFLAPANFPYGGLRGTLVHILDAEQGWLLFLRNNDWSAPDLNAEDFPTLDSIRERWAKEEKGFRAHLATLSDADMNVHREYDTPSGAHRDRIQWHCLLHIVNHGTQHRSEAAAILTDLGQSPGDLDFTVFLNSLIKS
ncbi:MAG TPA: DinB family protein [Anaerolineales bacterium]|jgi:uncharacterized damage-inducible protein DinB|nr:DinB family protein [Anaerolineales bacterium]